MTGGPTAIEPANRMLHDVRCIGAQSGALRECGQHPGSLVHRGDGVAERRAYSMATAHWKRGDYGPLITIGEVIAAVEDIVSNAAGICPECGAS